MLARWSRRAWFYAREVPHSWPERCVPRCAEIASAPLHALGHFPLREREMRARVIHFLLSTSVGCEICGVRDGIPHHWVISYNNCCSRLNLVCELLSKLGVEMNSG